MKKFAFMLGFVVVFTLAGHVFAGGDVHVSWSFTPGYTGMYGWGGHPWTGSPVVATTPAWHPPAYPPNSHGTVPGGNGGWAGVNPWHGHNGWQAWGGRPWGWGVVDLSHFPPGIYVIQPWYTGSYTFIGAGFEGGFVGDVEFVDPPKAPPGGGVFMVPVSGPPRAADDRLDGIRSPIAPTTAGPADAPAPRARRDLEGISKIFRMGGVERAETELGKIIRSNPSDAEVSCDYAYVLFLREKYGSSAFCLRRALMLNAKIASMGTAALSGFYDAKASEAALARIGEYIAANPADNSARLVRAWASILGGRADAALADLDVLLKANADDAQATALREVCEPLR